MKKLIFIDNDHEKRSLEDVDYIKSSLERLGRLSENQVEDMQIVSNLAHMDEDKIMDMVFNQDNFICTWSMYTINHYGSQHQMTSLFTTAAISKIKDMCYYDGSGELPKALERIFRNEHKATFDILNVIETNYILLPDFDNNCISRLRVELKGRYEPTFRKEKVNINKLING